MKKLLLTITLLLLLTGCSVEVVRNDSPQVTQREPQRAPQRESRKEPKEPKEPKEQEDDYLNRYAQYKCFSGSPLWCAVIKY